MSNVPTPHIGAAKEDIAKTVLMPGDPLRAQFIAETFLENAVCVNKVRNMLAFTGDYNGKRVTVMGGGMGMAGGLGVAGGASMARGGAGGDSANPPDESQMK